MMMIRRRGAPMGDDGPRVDAEDLRPLPLGQREDRLARLLARVPAGIAINEHTDEDGAVVFLHTCKMRLEGSCPSG
jgi:ATP-dependent DNA ligase